MIINLTLLSLEETVLLVNGVCTRKSKYVCVAICASLGKASSCWKGHTLPVWFYAATSPHSTYFSLINDSIVLDDGQVVEISISTTRIRRLWWWIIRGISGMLTAVIITSEPAGNDIAWRRKWNHNVNLITGSIQHCPSFESAIMSLLR